MAIVDRINYKTLNAAGDLFEINLAHVYSKYVLQGSGTLEAGISVQDDGGVVDIPDGTTVKIDYQANFVYSGGNKVNVFGRDLTAAQAIQNLDVTCRYDTSGISPTWIVNVVVTKNALGNVSLEDLNSNIYADDTTVQTGTNDTKFFTSLKLANWWTWVKTQVQTFTAKITFSVAFAISSLTSTKLLASSSDGTIQEVDLTEIVVIPVSFEAGEQCSNIIRVPFQFDILLATAFVTKAIAGTDSATITLKIAGTNVTDGVITIAASTGLDIRNTATPTALFSGSIGNELAVISDKTTAGGKALVTVHLKRKIS